MALLYRAIWEDSRPALEKLGEAAFVAWLQRKRLPIDALADDARGEGRDGAWVVSSRRAEADGTLALQARLVEDRPFETWTTTFTVLATPRDRTGWLWVDIDRTSADPFERYPFKAPRLVIDLIRQGEEGVGRPRAGGVGLSSKPSAMRADTLASVVLNPQRQLPLVVFAHDDEGGASITIERAREALARLAGIAGVYVLPPEERGRFNGHVGDDLRLETGAVRVYLPTSGPRGMTAGRHRFLPRHRIDRHAGAAGAAIVALLTPSATATPPPAAYKAVVRDLTLSGGASTEAVALLDAAFAENTELMAIIDQLRATQTTLEEQILDLQIETEGLQDEINRQAAHISALYAARGDAQATRTQHLPAQVATIAEAIACSESLRGVVVHPGAARDIDKLDQHLEGPKWANTIWRGLRALDEYGERGAQEGNGFWEWCRAGEAAWAWPASQKKLAMNESKTVLTSPRLRAARMLPIDPAVEPTGTILMPAHLKIAEGGGMLAPRLYFHDDTRGPTGKVHVGYIGPHEHMPNAGTN